MYLFIYFFFIYVVFSVQHSINKNKQYWVKSLLFLHCKHVSFLQTQSKVTQYSKLKHFTIFLGKNKMGEYLDLTCTVELMLAGPFEKKTTNLITNVSHLTH